MIQPVVEIGAQDKLTKTHIRHRPIPANIFGRLAPFGSRNHSADGINCPVDKITNLGRRNGEESCHVLSGFANHHSQYGCESAEIGKIGGKHEGRDAIGIFLLMHFGQYGNRLRDDDVARPITCSCGTANLRMESYVPREPLAAISGEVPEWTYRAS